MFCQCVGWMSGFWFISGSGWPELRCTYIGWFPLANFVLFGQGCVHVWFCVCVCVCVFHIGWLWVLSMCWLDVWFGFMFGSGLSELRFKNVDVAFPLQTLWWLGWVVFMYGFVFGWVLLKVNSRNE